MAIMLPDWYNPVYPPSIVQKLVIKAIPQSNRFVSLSNLTKTMIDSNKTSMRDFSNSMRRTVDDWQICATGKAQNREHTRAPFSDPQKLTSFENHKSALPQKHFSSN